MLIRDLIENDEPTRIKIGGAEAAAKAKTWIEKVYAKYPQTMQNNHVMTWGSGDDLQFAMFELVPSFSKRGAVEVKWIQAYPLRAGVGSRAMKELQSLAREDRISLTLFPWDKGQVSQAKLTKFYRGQGFAPTVKGGKAMQWSPELAEDLNQGIPSVLYHATYKPRLKSIKLKGLGAGGKRNWEDSKSGVIYLALDPNVAESYAESSDMVPDEWLDQIVILKISTAGLDPSKFSIDSNVQDNTGDTVEYHGVIPVSNISLYKQGLAEGPETHKQGHAKFRTKTNKQVGPTHYGRGSDKKADSYTNADPRYHEVRPVKEQGIAEDTHGMFSKVMGHETSPESAKQIQQQGFKKSHTGIFFNVGEQNYSGGGYGGTVIMAKVFGPVDEILNLEDDDLPEDLDEFADGEELADYARSKGYWAWTDGVQFAVLDPSHIQIKQGVAEGSLNEFAPGAGDEGGGEDPYRYPKPERYARSADYFGQFEADHFDREDFDDATGVFKGYWGNTPIAYFKFADPARTSGNDPGMGWYYEPESNGSSIAASAAPVADRSAQRKQQELGMINAFLKSGQTPKPGSQIYSMMKRHGLA